MNLRYFGTDGVRSRAFAPPLRLSDLTRWGAAWAQVASRRGIVSLSLGWDPRESSVPMVEAFVRGVGGVLPVRALGMVPTPAVASITSRMPNAWGVMISASHNPPGDNGVKGFDERGEKLSDADEALIEEAFEREAAFASGGEPRRLEIDAGAAASYIASLDTIEIPGDTRVVIDCAHGATAAFAPKVFLGGNVDWIGVPADGARINVGVGATNLTALQAAVRERGADVGFAFDGDGDRCLMVGPSGEVVDGDQIVWLLAQSRIAAREPPPGVVGTVMSNEGLARALSSEGVPFVRTPVGDRYLIQELRARGWDLAAEASGHLIQRRLGPTGDGMQTAASALRALLSRPREARWAFRFPAWPQEMKSLMAEERVPLEECRRLSSVMSALSREWGGELRVVVRWSGTEPKLRLMVEGKSEALVTEALRKLYEAASADLGLEIVS